MDIGSGQRGEVWGGRAEISAGEGGASGSCSSLGTPGSRTRPRARMDMAGPRPAEHSYRHKTPGERRVCGDFLFLKVCEGYRTEDAHSTNCLQPPRSKLRKAAMSKAWSLARPLALGSPSFAGSWTSFWPGQFRLGRDGQEKQRSRRGRWEEQARRGHGAGG